ncbi:MAG: dihydroorotase [Solirubrobacterales bacterium]
MKPISELSLRRGDPAELLLRRVAVLDPAAGVNGVHDVLVRDGRIAELAAPGEAAEPDGVEVVEAEGMSAFPAFFDPHVHLRTPGQEHKEDVETGSRAAAAGGFCAVLAMANTDPPIDTAAGVRALCEAAESEASVGVGFLACVTRGMRGEELTDMAELRDAGAVGFSDDGLPVRSARMLRKALQYQRLAGLPIALHEEDPDLSGDGVMHEGPVSAALGLAGIPAVSESTAIARDTALAGCEEAQIHVQHLSCRGSIEAIARAKDAGVRVTTEVTPHHLTLTEEEVRTLDASRFKMNPPLRSEDDRQALIEGFRSGVIDCIGTDHAPHATEEKEVPFEQAAMGVTGLETAFAVLHTELVLPGVLGLGLVIERLTAGAEPFGFERPTLALGSEANLVLVDLEAEWEAAAEGWESRSDNSSFHGHKLCGRVLMTLAAGGVAYRQRSFAMGVA